MNLSLYNSLINFSIDNTSGKLGGTDLTNQLKGVNNLFTGKIPVVLDTSRVLTSETDWGQEFIIEPLTLEGNGTSSVKQIIQLQDNSIVVLNSDGPARHYNSSWVLKSALPFTYTTTITTEYTNPGRSCTIAYSTLSGNVLVSGSVLLLPQIGTHVVQVYKWESARWKYLCTLGTVGSDGNTTGLLDSPVAVDGYFDVTSSKFTVYVSCTGNSSTARPSFIKKFEITLTGTIVDKGEVLVTTSANAGAMERSEATLITCLKAFEDGRLALLSPTNQELGILDMNTTIAFPIPQPLEIIKQNVKELPYNDFIASPTTFSYVGDKFVIGDSRGHLAILKSDLTDVEVYIGKTQPSVTTEYPLDFGSISDIALVGTDLVFIVGTKLFITNLASLQEQTVTYHISNILAPVEMAGIYGLECIGQVFVQVNSLDAIPAEQACCDSFPLGSTVKIKVVRSVQDVIAKKITDIPEAVLILKI